MPRLSARLRARQVVGLGFLLTAAGFAAIGFVGASWPYRSFLLPLIAVAVGDVQRSGLVRVRTPGSACLVGVHPRRATHATPLWRTLYACRPRCRALP
ncbi:hypothetical protein GCM10009740_35090 [Terrabacter terrae]|uniref:Uncharacterized protein n=1 Tax=Terrabacter terrae TaxID=318434 RepID=A0ABP5G302_9MICO